MKRRLSHTLIVTLLSWLLTAAASHAADPTAPTAWELMPYRIKLLAAVEDNFSVAVGTQSDLSAEVAARAAAVVGGAWRLEAVSPSAELRHAMLTDLGQIPAQSLPSAALAGDKVMLLAVRSTEAGFQVRARELDVVTGLWNNVVSADVQQADNLRHEAFKLVLEAFAPIARIESTDGKVATLKLRGGAIPRRDKTLSLLAPRAVFRPVLVTTDSQGAVQSGQVAPIPWTFLSPTESRGPLVTCKIDTGLSGSPIPDYHPQRLRLAVAVAPGQEATLLKLIGQGNSAPLEGYEVLAEQPPSGSGKASGRELIGLSDRQGIVVVPPGPQTLRLLVVRRGEELLARVPLVPGLAVEQSLALPDAGQQLEIEIAALEIEDSLVDLAARRESLAARVRTAFAKNEAAPAIKLVQQMRELPSADTILARLDQADQALGAVDREIQRRWRARLAGLRKLAQQLHADKPVERLEAELKGGKVP